ncbi:MAG: ADP-ribosylglycohydrolase family protein [Gemmatimonadota bacterium]|nr:ADP-ribosylglycohydrolase family protein [Gemmatimonadota bacterium]
MRDPADSDTLEAFYRASVGMGFAGRKDLDATARITGGLFGLVVGDALGVPVQFQPRERVRADPVEGMDRSFRHHPPGTWSDDSSMALALADSLAENGWDLADQMERFRSWLLHGDYTPHGESWDIGRTTRDSITRYDRGVPIAETGDRDESRNGNGSLMRLLPASIWLAGEEPRVAVERAMRHSEMTHGHIRARLCCAYHALLVRELLGGAALRAAMEAASETLRPSVPEAEREVLAPILTGEILDRAESDVESSGYVVHTLEASLWCLDRHDDYRSATLAAVNLGGDADTTGAVTGGLAGVTYGMPAVPTPWIQRLESPDRVWTIVRKFESAARPALEPEA